MSTPNNSQNFSYDIYGGIDAELDAAYAANIANSADSVSPTLTTAAILNTLPPDITPNTLVNLDPAFQAAAEATLETTTNLFERLGLATPDFSQLAEAGVDFDKLAAAHETMTSLNLAPEFVIAPVLSMMQWQELYQVLQDNPQVNHDGRIKSGGLWMHDDVKAAWHELNDTAHAMTIDGTDWQALVLPGTSKSPIVNVDHNGMDGQKLSRDIERQAQALDMDVGELVTGIPHPTIASYLTLQATKLQNNQDTTDNNTWTWLDGEFGDASNLQAPSGRWNPDDGQVRLYRFSVGCRSVDLGVRLPVWG